jgi:alpha-L-fucosidase
VQSVHRCPVAGAKNCADWFLIWAILLLMPLAAMAAYQPTWASVDQHDPAPEWFQDAKFGIYFHWGVFSVPAFENEWYPRNMYNTGDPAYSHHVATYGDPFNNSPPPFFPYHYFISGHTNLAGVFCQFAPVLKSQGGNFDPDEWAQLFVNAGARFAGPVSEHHDGFSMWNSTVNEWNSLARGPNLDLAAIWATAIRAKGLKFLMTQHTAYHFNGYYQYVPSQVNPSLQKLYGQLGAAAENQLWFSKLKEIIDAYQPDLIYQDFDLSKVAESNRLSFLSYYYNSALAWNSEVVATYKDGFDNRGEVYAFERGGAADILTPYWLGEESVSPTSWCYTTGMSYYPTNALIDELIDRVSKNGNWLLNIAPMADGTIPAAQQGILLGIGDWLGRFGECIYSNRAWVIYGEGPTSMGGGSFGRPVVGTSADIRFMRNKAANTVYAVVMGWPGSQCNISSLNSLAFNMSTLTNVQLLGTAAGTYIDLPPPNQDFSGLKIALPARPFSSTAYVIKLAFSGVIPVLTPVLNYQWSPPRPITTADVTLNQPGTIVGAACFGATSSAITVTLSSHTNIVFKGDGTVATCSGQGTAIGAFTPNTTGNAAFDTVLNGFEYDNGPHTITLKNLTPGQLYSVQLFALDDRNDSTAESSRLCNFQAPINPRNSSATFGMGNNVYVVGTFIDLDTNMVIRQNLPTGNKGNLNALVIRRLPSANILILNQPQSLRCHPGDSAQLAAYVAGETPLSCQWQAAALGSGVFTNLPSSTTVFLPASNLRLSFINLTSANTADYRLVLSNASGSVTSSVATLTVKPPLFAWQAPVPILTADASLSLPGTVVGAARFGTTSSSIAVTLSNGSNIIFKGDGSVATCTGAGAYSGASNGHTTGNANFDAVLNSFEYDNGPHLITLKGLTAGQLYSVQLFGLDDRTGGAENTRLFNYQDPDDPTDISQTARMGDNVYVTGTFAAPGSNVIIRQNLPTSNQGNLNALVVRQLEPPVIGGIQVLGSNLIITATNSTPGAVCYVLATTNLSLPVTNWTIIGTNQFGPCGSLTWTNPLNPSVPQTFFRLLLR